MTAQEIIKKWLEYTQYDPECKSWALNFGNMADFDLKRCCDRLPIVSKYDPTGSLAVMYIKNAFRKAMAEVKYSLSTVFGEPRKFQREREMWNILHSNDVTEIEDRYLNAFRAIAWKAAANRIGNERPDVVASELFSSIDAVVEQLSVCNERLFMRGNTIRLANFSSYIHIFPSLSSCLLALESASDGIYTCFIRYGNSPDSFFGFFIKSNGTILSIDEQCEEAYPGAHKNSRIGRWADKKADRLFPYDHILEYADHNRKGYAQSYKLKDGFAADESRIDMFSMPPAAYMPLILGMIMVANRYTNEDLTRFEQVYIDSMVGSNACLSESEALALSVQTNSGIMLANKDLNIIFTSNDVSSGRIAARLNEEGGGSFYGEDNLFAQIYGDGFVLDTQSLLKSETLLMRLTGSELSSGANDPTPEFVGAEVRMETIAYMRGREQLAAHIRAKMLEEYKNFGGADAVEAWWNDIIVKSKDRIIDFCVRKYEDVAAGKEVNVVGLAWDDCSGNPLSFISFSTEPSNVPGFFADRCPLNEPVDKERDYWRKMCSITDAKANVFFYFKFKDWEQMASVFGEENIPKILKGWNSQGHHTRGNSILCPTDAVEDVGTPFELREKKREPEYNDAPTQFVFCVGLSKRGLAQLKKQKKCED